MTGGNHTKLRDFFVMTYTKATVGNSWDLSPKSVWRYIIGKECEESYTSTKQVNKTCKENIHKFGKYR